MALLPMICTVGLYGYPFVTATGPSGVTANRIIYCPIVVPEAFTVLQVGWANVGSNAGNINVGLYSSAGSKLWETGSTAQTGTNQLQRANIADQAHAAGAYYVAYQQSSTGQIVRLAPGIPVLSAFGVFQEDAGSFALPATATFAKLASDFLPLIALDLRGTP